MDNISSENSENKAKLISEQKKNEILSKNIHSEQQEKINKL